MRVQGVSYQDRVHTKNPGVFSARAQTGTQYPTIKTSPVQLNGSVGQALALCGNELPQTHT